MQPPRTTFPGLKCAPIVGAILLATASLARASVPDQTATRLEPALVSLAVLPIAPPSDLGSTASPSLEGTRADLGSQRLSLFSRRDGVFALATAAVVATVWHSDRLARHEALESQGQGARTLSRTAEHFGNLLDVGPIILVAYAAGRQFHRPELSSSSVKVGEAVLATSVLCQAIKFSVGRARPFEAGGATADLRPFTRADASFPSGHAAIAFAAASAIDQNTSARWVPWVVYPIAGLVGWSRVHDDRHWTSDVVAGAALGTWVGWKLGPSKRAAGPEHHGFTPMIEPGLGGLKLGGRIGF